MLFESGFDSFTNELKDITMKKVNLSLLLIGALTLLGQNGVFADERKLVAEHTEHSDQAECVEKFAPIKLTDAQLESIHAIKAKYIDADEPNISQLHRLHRKSFELMSGLNVNKDDLMSMQSKINAIESELSNQRLRMTLELRDVLTAEQKADVHQHMLEREAGPGGFGGPRGMGGPGGGMFPHDSGWGVMPFCTGPGMPPPAILPPPGPF
jgi:Spy/CpxP family protein refolding chaperone